MKVIEVSDKKTIKKFLRFPETLYRNDPNWVCPLYNDIESVFDPKKNDFFSQGICTRWLLMDDRGNTIGRIAAFINYEKINTHSIPAGGIGFFECVNIPEAAFLLFDTAMRWLKQKNMKAMDGPINFGENDKYWGLLVDGFKPPSLGMNYNPPYYQHLFESYGFRKQYDQFTNFLEAKPISERFKKIADWVMQKPGYSFRHFHLKDFEKQAADLRDIYNDAWNDFENFTPLKLETIRNNFRLMKPVMDEKLIWFAYYNNEPISFILCLPDINQVLKHLHGRMNLWGKLKFLWFKNSTQVDRIRIIVMGCKKKFQNRGIESALIRCLQNEVLPRKNIKGVELAWVGDWNKKMISIHEATGAIRDKVHRTYRYIFPEQ